MEGIDERIAVVQTEGMNSNECDHENTRQIDEHDVECMGCGAVSA